MAAQLLNKYHGMQDPPYLSQQISRLTANINSRNDWTQQARQAKISHDTDTCKAQYAQLGTERLLDMYFSFLGDQSSRPIGL